MAQRLRGRYGYPLEDPFKPTFHQDRLGEPGKIKKPSKIFVCSMGEFFSASLSRYDRLKILDVIKKNPQHTFQLLTKEPIMLPLYSYPENMWVGISVTNQKQVWGIKELRKTNARIKFISFEPLTEKIIIDLHGVDWIIIGAQTQPLKLPDCDWVNRLIGETIYYNIPIFLKSNIKTLCATHPDHIFSIVQDFPDG